MKHLKMLSLAALAAMVLMAFVGAGTASATTLVGVGASVLGKGSKIEASLDPGTGPAKLTTSFKTIECEEATISMTTSNETGTAVEGNAAFTFNKCNCEVKVWASGTLSVSVIGSGPNGTVKSSAFEVTSQCNNTLFGNVHCIYQTSITDLGTLTGTNTTGATATMDIESANIPRLTTSSLCTEKAQLDAKYVVNNPDVLNVIS